MTPPLHTGRSPSDTTRASVPVTLTLTLVSLVTVASFCRIFPDWSFATALAGSALTGHLAAFGLRAVARHGRRTSGVVAVPLALAAVAVVVGRLHLHDTLWWGLPTRTTWTVARSQLSIAWDQIGVVTPPLAFTGGFALMSLLSVGVAAVVADAVAFRTRARAEALVPAGAVFLVVSAVGIDRLRAEMTAMWFAAALLHVAAARADAADHDAGWVGRHRAVVRAWSVAGGTIALTAAAIALSVGPRLPGAGAEPLLEPRVRESTSRATSLEPLVDVRGRLTSRSDAVLFSVKSDRPTYWRIAGLDEFDGSTWSLPSRELESAGGALDTPRPFGTPVVQTFVVERLGGNLVPVAASPTDLRSSDLDLFYASDSGTLVVGEPGLSRGAGYQIVSSVASPPAGALDAASATSPPRASSTDLPATWNPELTAVARAVTDGAATPYGRALALQNWFRTEFRYDLDVRLDSSITAIEQFLEIRRGYCEQFAGTFAALARSIGLPARVAIGFTPGDLGADGVLRVRGRHAHAWPEVWFDDIGWIGFEPTPGRGDPSAEQHTGVESAQADDPGTAAAPAAPDTSPGAAAPTTGPDGPEGTTDGIAGADGEVPPPAGQGAQPSATLGWALALVLALAVWCTAMPAAVGRWVRSPDPDVRLVDDWNSTVAAMRFAGVRVDPAATPHETAEHIARNSGIDRHDLVELAHTATHVLYGASPLDPERRDRGELVGRHVRESALSVLPLRWRLRGRIDPRVAARLARG